MLVGEAVNKCTHSLLLVRQSNATKPSASARKIKEGCSDFGQISVLERLCKIHGKSVNLWDSLTSSIVTNKQGDSC